MKKPSAKNIRSGQTIWYPHRSYASPLAVYEVRKVTVLPDSADLPPTYLIAEGFPRWYIRERFGIGGGPAFVSYSRRRVLSWIKLHGWVRP